MPDNQDGMMYKGKIDNFPLFFHPSILSYAEHNCKPNDKGFLKIQFMESDHQLHRAKKGEGQERDKRANRTRFCSILSTIITIIFTNISAFSSSIVQCNSKDFYIFRITYKLLSMLLHLRAEIIILLSGKYSSMQVINEIDFINPY